MKIKNNNDNLRKIFHQTAKNGTFHHIYIYIYTQTHTHTYIHILTLKNLAFCSHSIIMGIVLFTQWAMIISLTAVTGVSPLWIEDVHYIR